MSRIGDIIDARPDGSFIYFSNLGILNLDNWRDLEEAQEDDKRFLETDPRR